MMYERPELAQSHQRLWSLIRKSLNDRGIASPVQLSQSACEFEVWKNPDLVLSQTCGMPYRTWLHCRAQLVATPDYDLEGCPPGYYRSALIVRCDDSRTTITDFKNASFAYNQPFSQSGYAAAFWHSRAYGFWFSHKYHSGAHVQSALAVADGRADVAALDAVSWRLIQQHDVVAEKLRVLDWTDPTPGLPLITSLRQNKDLVRSAVYEALDTLSAGDCALLGIKGLVQIAADDYLAVANPDLAECQRLPDGLNNKA